MDELWVCEDGAVTPEPLGFERYRRDRLQLMERAAREAEAAARARAAKRRQRAQERLQRQ